MNTERIITNKKLGTFSDFSLTFSINKCWQVKYATF